MSSRHPIDEVFRDKLAQHSMEPPMHLWDKIDQTRNKRKRGGLYVRFLSGTALLGIAILALWAIIPTHTTNLRYLPIPLGSGDKTELADDQVATTGAKAGNELATSASTKEEVTKNFPEKTPIVNSKKTSPQISQTNSTTIEVPSEIEKVADTPNLDVEEKMALWDTPELPVLAFQEQKMTDASPFEFNDPTDCAKFRKRPWKFFATFGGAIDLARRQMSPKDADGQAYVDTRENTELPFYTFSLDARASVVSPIGLGFTTGLDYTQINEKFDYVDPDAERTEIITTEYGPNGEIVGADTVLILGSREIITYNRYRILDIPLLANYELDFTHFALEVKGGILINILSRQKGDFLSPTDLEPTSFTTDKSNAYPAFRQHIGIGYYGGMSFNYKLNSGYQLSFEPFFRVYPKSFTRSDFPVTQKYFLTGLKLGLKVPLR